jgi:hypothetical protein
MNRKLRRIVAQGEMMKVPPYSQTGCGFGLVEAVVFAYHQPPAPWYYDIVGYDWLL